MLKTQHTKPNTIADKAGGTANPCKKQNSAFAARSKTASTKALVAYGGNVCESNTSKTFCTPRNGFEDRGAHRSPSVPKCGGILPNRAANLAQGAQAAGILVEHRKAHGIQVL